MRRDSKAGPKSILYPFGSTPLQSSQRFAKSRLIRIEPCRFAERLARLGIPVQTDERTCIPESRVGHARVKLDHAFELGPCLLELS